MIKRKAAVAVSIFSTLFAGAWWLNVDQKRDYHNQMKNPNSIIAFIGDNQVDGQGSISIMQPFKPREYIRVVVVKNKEEEQEVEPT